jgi:hypothetical protein
MKTYVFDYAYEGRKIITAHLSSITEEMVQGKMIELFSSKNSHVNIGIEELRRGIESGAYDTVDEVWEDIKYSGRMISPTTFGGKKWLDKNGVKSFFDNWVKTGDVLGDGKKIQEEPFHDPDSFYHFRLRVKRGEISKEYFDEIHNTRT